MYNQNVVTSFYKFLPIKDPQALQHRLIHSESLTNATGLILVGPEGINGSVCLAVEMLKRFQNDLRQEFGDMLFKTSAATDRAFTKLKIKVRREIVTMGRPELCPQGNTHHECPRAWHDKALKGAQILDVRNHYETRIGTFANAVDLQLREFVDFPAQLKASGLDKNRETLIFCTGGIRCEKAILEMQRQGFSKVLQLSGGILKYIEEYGSAGQFQGECFVFDYRVAVDSNLMPTTQYRLCPHCGEPAAQDIVCSRCGQKRKVCETCLQKDPHHHTCSKNCRHHSRKGHDSRKPHADGLVKSGG